MEEETRRRSAVLTEKFNGKGGVQTSKKMLLEQ
jgi:hypothetical protein